MKELEAARQRLEEKSRLFDSIKPILIRTESEYLQSLQRINSIRGEARTDIEKREKQKLSEATIFYYSPSDHPNVVITHFRSVMEDGSEKDWWGTLAKKEVNRRFHPDPDGTKILVDYDLVFDWNSPMPESVINGVRADGRNWAQANLKIIKVDFWYMNPDPTGKNEIVFRVEGHKYEERFISVRGPMKRGQIEMFTAEHSLKMGGRVDSFAEKVVLFIDQRKYHESEPPGEKNTNTSDKQENTPPEILSDQRDGAPTGQPDKKDAGQWRVMQEGERDRVLAEIERREGENPNYHRPGWISEDEKSSIAKMGSIISEHDRFTDEEAFQAAIQHHFPHPPEN